jgi:hypothetical protein
MIALDHETAGSLQPASTAVELGILADRRAGKSIFYRGEPLRHQIMRPKGGLEQD